MRLTTLTLKLDLPDGVPQHAQDEALATFDRNHLAERIRQSAQKIVDSRKPLLGVRVTINE